MTLISEALDLQRKDIIAVVGGGGKTTIIYTLARELQSKGFKVVISTTTKMYTPSDMSIPIILTGKMKHWYDDLREMLTFKNCVFVGKDINSEGKVTGLYEQEVCGIWKNNNVDIILIEADGTKGKPFKAPRRNEPVVPNCSTVVIPVVGVDSIGKPLVQEYFHAV